MKLNAQKLEKLKALQEKGINPFPYEFDRTHYSQDLQEHYKEIKAEEKTSDKVSVAGRIMLFRMMGKASFIQIQDVKGKIQAYFKQDDLGKDTYKLLKKLDLGDILGIKGFIFRTKTNELTIHVESFTILSKSLLNLPEKFHGLADKEIRYRKRYLDLITNPEVKEVFYKRAKIIQTVRDFLNKKGFLEVETPAIQTIYGGTNAKPFKTHINAFNEDVYMRLAPELYLKRLIIGGLEKVYEIGKNFRNEGADLTHNPEFTMIEWYEAYADYHAMMDTAEEMYKAIAKELYGGFHIQRKDRRISLTGKWPRVTMTDCIQDELDIDVTKMSQEKLLEYVENNNIPFRGSPSKGILISSIFEKKVVDNIKGPVWIIDYPKEVSPLAKPHRSKEGFVERFECYIDGMEVGDGWSELVNPIEQRDRFENEQKSMQEGNDEAHPLDEDFLEAMAYGMPTTGGIGIGIDRLTMLFCGIDSIRDVLFFPFMKPIKKESPKEKS